MRNHREQVSGIPSNLRANIAFLVSVALILLGIVIELGEIGYGPLSSGVLWVATVIVRSAWNALAVGNRNFLELGVREFWPLALSGVGMLLLLLIGRGKRGQARAAGRFETGETHVQ